MSKKTAKPATTTAEERGYYKYDWFNLAVFRCNGANDISEEQIYSIQRAYFEKGLSLDDLVDVFNIPKIILNLLIVEPDEHEKEEHRRDILPIDYDGFLGVSD